MHKEERVVKSQTYLELCATCHHLLERNTDTLNDGQQYCTTNSTVSCLLHAASYGERATCEETGCDGIPGILLLADTLDCAVECREQATPYTKVAAQNWCAHLDGCYGADASFADGRVPPSFDTVPDGTADSLEDLG